MIDFWPLFAVLGLFYLLEGLWWAPTHAVCFSRGLWGRFTTTTPLVPRRDTLRGFVFPRHLVANSDRFLCCAWPIAISPDGITPRDITLQSDPEASSRPFIPYDRIDSLSASQSGLAYNGKVFAHTSSSAGAENLLRLCRELAASEKHLRAKKIAESIDDALDQQEVRRCIRRLRWLLRRRKWVPVALLGNLFFLAPTSVALFGYSGWYVPITLHIGLAAVAVVTFLRTSAKLRVAGDNRFATASMLLLFPPSTARYEELLSRDLLSFHPIATAIVTLDRDSVRHLARRDLMRHGTNELGGAGRENLSYKIDAWYRDAFEARLVEVLDEYGLHSKEILRPPAPEPGALTYCPRCHAQYRSGFEECADCDGVALVPHSQLGTDSP